MAHLYIMRVNTVQQGGPNLGEIDERNIQEFNENSSIITVLKISDT